MDPVRVDFHLNDSVPSIAAFLKRIGSLADSGTADAWALDLSACRYLGPDAVALVAALVIESRESGQQPTVTLPREPGQLVNFCRYSGLAHLLGQRPPPNPDHPECETVPVARFQTALWGASEPLVRLIRRHTELSLDDEDALRLCINEVSQNIDDHAKSAIGGIFSARYFSASEEVRVAIVDRGLGIATTLAARYPSVHSSAEALGLVLGGKYSSRSKPGNRGLGIQSLAETVRRLSGKLVLVSGNACASLDANMRTPYLQALGGHFRGTGVFFTLPLRGVDIAEPVDS